MCITDLGQTIDLFCCNVFVLNFRMILKYIVMQPAIFILLRATDEYDLMTNDDSLMLNNVDFKV